MKTLIKSARIVDSKSSYNNKVKDILINNGIIEKIADDIPAKKDMKVVEAKDLHVSTGWCDLRANFQDPGFEHKEDIESGILAAAAGGFTSVALSPATEPVIDSKSGIDYIKNRTKGSVVDILPMGAVSQKMQGKDLAELYDMKQAGAIAFTDDKKSISNPNLLLRSMMYCKAFNGLVINYPNTKEVSGSGVMNEGNVSTLLGLKGIPELSEEIMVARDIYLAEYTQGRLHFSTISSPKSVELIKEAKAKGIQISCDVPSYLLLLDDTEIEEFDTRFKTLPPIRSKVTRTALIAGVKNGTIDAICSNHEPEDVETKKMEFDHAAFGVINLQTAFASTYTALKGKVELDKIIDCISTNPRKILGLPVLEIKEGAPANLSFFTPNESIVLEKKDIHSKSLNSPFIGKKLEGKVYGIYNSKKLKVFK